MSNLKYSSINRLLAKIDRDYGMQGVSEVDAIEWIGEALEAIGVHRQYEEAVAFIEVRDHQIVLPAGLHAIIQIARNNCWVDKNQGGLCPTDLIPKTPPVTENPLDTPPAACPIIIDGDGMPLQEYDLAYYRPYFDLKYEYQFWMDHAHYRSCFTPVNLATSTFFHSIVCVEEDRERLYHNCNDEYSLIKGEVARFSFREGQVAISYLRQVLDEETGYPSIPDEYSYMQAITKYVIMMLSQKEFYNGREGSAGRLAKAEDDWQWYCAQASAKAMMPQGIDEMENLLHQRNYMIPRLGEYSSFFGKLGRPEGRKFNNPDYRNKYGYHYFRGY